MMLTPSDILNLRIGKKTMANWVFSFIKRDAEIIGEYHGKDKLTLDDLMYLKHRAQSLISEINNHLSYVEMLINRNCLDSLE